MICLKIALFFHVLEHFVTYSKIVYLRACTCEKLLGWPFSYASVGGHSGNSIDPSSLDIVESSELYKAVDSQQNFPEISLKIILTWVSAVLTPATL